NCGVLEFLLVLRSASGGSGRCESGWPQAVDAFVNRFKGGRRLRWTGGIFWSRFWNYAYRDDLDHRRQRIRARDSVLYSGMGNPAGGSGAVLSNGESRCGRDGAGITCALERTTKLI